MSFAQHTDTVFGPPPIGPLDIAKVWTPQPGFQTKGWHLQSFEALVGGAAGPGKTDLLIYRGLKQCHNPRFRKLLLRRTFPELREIIDRTLLTFPQLGGVWRASEKRWAFPSGASYEFGYCETYADVLQYQGQEYTEIDVDEGGQWGDFLRMWTFLMSRVRRGGDGLTMSMWCSANPGGPGHVALKTRYVDVCPSDGTPVTDPTTGLTRAFLAGRLADNPILLEKDPLYVQKLMNLPELERKQLLEGDWDAGDGLALPEMRQDVHLVRKQDVSIQRHWTVFGSFDWGYNHPFSFGLYTVPGDGHVLKLDTITGRRMQDHQILEYLRAALKARGYEFSDLDYVVAGGDCWGKYEARAGQGPSTAERFAEGGLYLRRAHDGPGSRVQNLTTARHYTAYRKRGAHGSDIVPFFRMIDTPGNRQCFQQLHGAVCDPDKPEQVLKTDADASGQGGDDMLDETFYALASRPYTTLAPERVAVPDDLQATAWAYERGEEPQIVDDNPFDATDHGY